jgi:hypothetical protein
MWAQMITSRLKPDREADMEKLTAQLKAAEQPGSGLVHATASRDPKDPSRVILFVVFESEEKARERELDPRSPRWTQGSSDDHDGDLRRCSGLHGPDRRRRLVALIAADTARCCRQTGSGGLHPSCQANVRRRARCRSDTPLARCLRQASQGSHALGSHAWTYAFKSARH